MTKQKNKIARTVALTLTAAALTAGVASAQVHQIPARDDRPVIVNLDVKRPTRPVTVVRPVGGHEAFPAVIAAGAAVVLAAVEVAHRVTERWIDPGISLPSRGGLVNVGAYDR